MHLEPLTPEHAALDFAAIMGSREHLQRTLRWGSWPRMDFTLEENAADLTRHATEFTAREAYAYTVLSPDRATCIGCVYLERVPQTAESESVAAVAYWTVESGVAAGLDQHLLESVRDWIEQEWPFAVLRLAVHSEHRRGLQLAEQAGFSPSGEPADEGRQVFQLRLDRRR